VKLSTRNQIRATVVEISHGEAIANVVMEAGGQRLVRRSRSRPPASSASNRVAK
jgi:molybdopterin-binding protein